MILWRPLVAAALIKLKHKTWRVIKISCLHFDSFLRFFFSEQVFRYLLAVPAHEICHNNFNKQFCVVADATSHPLTSQWNLNRNERHLALTKWNRHQPVFTRALELCEGPSCFKSSTIIPASPITGSKDYRRVATEMLEEAGVEPPEGHHRNPAWPLQFAYQAKRSTVNIGLHHILRHLKTPVNRRGPQTLTLSRRIWAVLDFLKVQPTRRAAGDIIISLFSAPHHSLVWFCPQTRPAQTATDSKVTGTNLPSIHSRYLSRTRSQTCSNRSHPGHGPFKLRPSGQCHRALEAKTSWLQNRFNL